MDRNGKSFFFMLLPVSLCILLNFDLTSWIHFIFIKCFVVKRHHFLLFLSLHPLRDLVTSQRAVSTATTPSRNFFSTFLPQGRRTPAKTPPLTSGSSPSQLAVGRKDPPTNPVRTRQVIKSWSRIENRKFNFFESRPQLPLNSKISKRF